MHGDLNDLMLTISVMLLPLVLAITFHEAAHGFVAWRCGDDTAYRMGRVTFNPLRHIDPFGTIILPLMLRFATGFAFGYAKPVPVNASRFRHYRRDMILVAVAGPGSNLILAFIAEHEKGPGETVPDGAIVLHCYGRFCNATKFAGEVDVMEALQTVRRAYKIDPDRIIVRGFSMGGASTWHLAGLLAPGWSRTRDLKRTEKERGAETPEAEALKPGALRVLRLEPSALSPEL